jgi:hypothetical protein
VLANVTASVALDSDRISLCLRRQRDAKGKPPSDVALDFCQVAAEIERVSGQIVVLPIQNIAACLQRFRKADCRARTLDVRLGDEERLGEIVLQFERALNHLLVVASIRLELTVCAPTSRDGLQHPLANHL